MTADTRPVVGLMLGDVTGIGAEIATKMLAAPEVRALARTVLIGDARHLALGCRESGAQVATHAAARAVLDQHLLPGSARQAVHEDPADNVGRAARGLRDDHPDRACRPALGLRAARPVERNRDRNEEPQLLHT